MKFKLLIAALATSLAAETASAQVFVIGNGLGGECYQKTKNTIRTYRDAEEVCSRALREQAMTKANRAGTFVNRGVLRMRDGNYDGALKDYESAIELVPDLGAAYLNQGAAYIYIRDFDSAFASLNRAIELDSADLFAAYYNRAIAREQTGDVTGAYYDFQKSLELKPDWDLAMRQLNRFSIADQG